MATFQAEVVHRLTRAEATARLRRFSSVVLSDLPAGVSDVEENWEEEGCLDFRFRAFGLEISGNMTIEESAVNVSGAMPFAGLPFKGALEKQIAEKIQQALDG